MANHPYTSQNLVILKGFLGKDPALREVASRTAGKPAVAVCNFSVATYKVINDVKYTQWHNVTCYRQLASAFAAEARKGDFVYVQGELRSREFQTAEDKAEGKGRKRTVFEIEADEAYVLPVANARIVREPKAADQRNTGSDDGEPPHLEPIPEGVGASETAALPSYIV